MIHKDASQLIANGLVNECSRHRRIYTTREPEDHVIRTDLLANLSDSFIHIVRHIPVSMAAADVSHKAREHRLTLNCMRHLGVELHAIKLFCLIRHASNRT